MFLCTNNRLRVNLNSICPIAYICIVLEVVRSSIDCKSNHKELASEPANICGSLHSLKTRYIVSTVKSQFYHLHSGCF